SVEKIVGSFRPIHKLLYNKYYFDEIYDAIIVRPTLQLARYMWSFDNKIIDGAVNGTGWATIKWSDIKEWFDTWIVDGAVNGVGWLVRQWSNVLRFMQTGKVQFYAMFILIMVVLFGLLKVDLAAVKYSWPEMTIVFLGGLSLLVLLSRMITVKEKSRSNSKEEE
ncbi:MAG: hypothetical protein ACE5K8_04920, partial [Candidatus Zixiibacteriota bacterium]